MRASPLTRAVAGEVATPMGRRRRPGPPGPPARPRPRRGWEHLLDVAEEEAVGAHHQHTLALEGEPVGVQQVRARWRATTVLPVPGPPCTTSTPANGERMTTSCSPWIVATMSDRRPVRDSSSGDERLWPTAQVPSSLTDTPHPAGRRPRRTARPRCRAACGRGWRSGGGGRGPSVPDRWPGRTARRPGPASRRPVAPASRRTLRCVRCSTCRPPRSGPGRCGRRPGWRRRGSGSRGARRCSPRSSRAPSAPARCPPCPPRPSSAGGSPCGAPRRASHTRARCTPARRPGRGEWPSAPPLVEERTMLPGVQVSITPSSWCPWTGGRRSRRSRGRSPPRAGQPGRRPRRR